MHNGLGCMLTIKLLQIGVSKDTAMELAKEVDYNNNNIISYYEFANVLPIGDKPKNIVPEAITSKILTETRMTHVGIKPPPKTVASDGNINTFNPADTALSIDLGAGTPAEPHKASRHGSRAGSGRATPSMRAVDSKTAYQLLAHERAIEQHNTELYNVAALPDGTPRRA